ncbi:variable surface protein [Plasmodium gonderi]|uniref:Variable surface protein n=1 Tax=Plasmodium gonderi TaxID=77519 RepID=A0A1Y1JFH0_PLAGO|nr:variable surface protein [Plasmodium gonderi]GAW81246.1 variable surface protein [Plasmodium gonderi]
MCIIDVVNDPRKYLEWKCNSDNPLNINFNRLLAKTKNEENSEQKCLNIKHSVHGRNKEMKKVKIHAPTYKKVKKMKMNELNYYMKSYKDRYDKRIGLGKLDCYCENKIFKGIDKISKLANSANMTKSKFKKKIRKKYGLRIGLIYFFYVLALSIGTLDIINRKCSLGICKEFYDDGGEFLIPLLGDIFVYVIPTILTLIIIYVMMKIVKYERLKLRKYFTHSYRLFAYNKYTIIDALVSINSIYLNIIC